MTTRMYIAYPVFKLAGMFIWIGKKILWVGRLITKPQMNPEV
jgi:hypothetical protein